MAAFSEIIGHEQIIGHLQNAIRTGKISHAYILDGEEGAGKSLLARAFAQTLQCEQKKADACGECRSCRQAAGENQPDIIRVSHEKPNSIGVDEIREQLCQDMQIRPYSSPYKIYLVDEAEKMTVQAQNALLKTIEEPPSYAVLILITANPDAFLPTILSRCVQLKLKPLRDSIIRDFLTDNLSVPEIKADVYAAFARGNLGRAKKMAESEDFQHLYDELLYLLKNIRDMDISMLLSSIKKMKDEDADLFECLDFMQVWYRDVLMFKVTKDANLLIFKDEYSAINELSQKTGYDGFENILQAIDKAKVRLEANVNMELALELMFLVMKEN